MSVIYLRYDISHLELDANTLDGTFSSKLKNFRKKKVLLVTDTLSSTGAPKRIIVTTTAK